jgi:2'-5' RNA ligase
MRLFFAIAVPEELARRIAEVQEQLRAEMRDPGIRWTRPEQFHYTLKFLGEQPVQRAYKAVETAQAIAHSRRPFTLTLGGVGAFPNAQRPNVLWIGATAGQEALISLAQDLDAALAREHFRRETKPPKAHLTLARIKTYDAEIAVSAKLPRVNVGEIGSLEADAMVLMQSVLKPTGSEYTVVERFRFEGGPE